MAGLTKWSCPGCAKQLEAVAVAVGHRCPQRKQKWADFIADDLSHADTTTPAGTP